MPARAITPALEGQDFPMNPVGPRRGHGDNGSVRTRFVLIEPSHAGNVGAVARALKVMGFDELVLVRPRWANVLRREEAIQRASGALDVLREARIVDALDDALEGVDTLCATAMVARDFGPPTLSPRAFCDERARRPTGGVAFLFGSERYGMRNEDVYRCHAALSIPTNPAFGSLNLAAAVQLIAYEWRQALGGFELRSATAPSSLADAAQVAGLLRHAEEALVALGYLDPAAPRKLMPRLQQLANRSGLTQEEVHILRGVAKVAIETSARART
jgi:tRNA/rRNA methyltransferase